MLLLYRNLKWQKLESENENNINTMKNGQGRGGVRRASVCGFYEGGRDKHCW